MRINSLHRLLRDRRGAIIPAVGVVFPLLLGATGLAVDASNWVRQRDSLQGIADAAAVAAVIEYGSISSTAESARAAEAIAREFGAANGGQREISITASATANLVEVVVREPALLAFAPLFGIQPFQIEAESQATMTPQPRRTCVLALDQTAKTGLTITGTAGFTATGCTLWSNAVSDQSIVIGGSAQVRAAHICASGRTVVNGTSASIAGSRRDRCAIMPDPLAAWAGPTPNRPCTARNLSINSLADVVLSPGTYCGGIRVSAKGSVTLQPGVYIMDGGPMTITADREITGNGVGIYLSGHNATLDITGQSTVSLAAAAYGPMDGIVVASDRSQSKALSARIAGGATVDLVGTVYLPTQTLVWRGNSQSGNPRRITQIVAAEVDIAGTTSISYEADFAAAGYEPIESYPLQAFLSR